MKNMPSRNSYFTLIIAAILLVVAYIAEASFDPYIVRILNMWMIYITMVSSFVLVYGITGQFTLAHAGLAAIGAYTVSLLTLPPDAKMMSFLLQSPHPLIADAQWPLLPALLLGGVLKGQELITSARVRNMISQQDGIKAAYFGFLDRYRALPGDYSAAVGNIKGVSKAGDRWWQQVRAAARARSLPQAQCDIVPAGLGDDAPLWGAAALAMKVAGN